jgi:5-methylcytosine-specific restriction protein B
MANRLEIIYKHLVGNRNNELKAWYNDYKSITEGIQIIKNKLNAQPPGKLTENTTYEGTVFKDVDADEPFKKLLKKLFYEKSNGVAGRGRSVISEENLMEIAKDEEFPPLLSKIIKDPKDTNYKRLVHYWESKKIGNNPLLINRAIAACTLEVSTTVDEKKFQEVFNWLLSEGLIEIEDNETNQDKNWFEKNILLVRELREKLNGTEGIDNYWINIFVWQIYEFIASPLGGKKQVVKYGPPGTGKTYMAKQTAKKYFEIWKAEFPNAKFKYEDCCKIIQFHPSFSYEDFVEGLRPRIKRFNTQLE